MHQGKYSCSVTFFENPWYSEPGTFNFSQYLLLAIRRAIIKTGKRHENVEDISLPWEGNNFRVIIVYRKVLNQSIKILFFII